MTIPYYMEIMGVDRPWHIYIYFLGVILSTFEKCTAAFSNQGSTCFPLVCFGSSMRGEVEGHEF